MPETMIFYDIQGNEGGLLERMNTFLSIAPAKHITHLTSWTMGIHVYILILFEISERPIGAQTKPFGGPEDMDLYSKALAPKPTYQY